MIVLQTRDKKILDFIEAFHAATPSHISKLFFSGYSQAGYLARRRLKKLYDEKLLKRERSNQNMEYIYYYKKSNQMNHQLVLVDFYIKLHRLGKVKEFTPEKVMGDIRPDAVIKLIHGSSMHIFCVEVEMSNNGFDQEKYEQFYRSKAYKEWFEVFPKVIVICDKAVKIEQTRLRFIQLGTDLNGMETILK